MAGLKSLSDNSNISVILVLASTAAFFFQFEIFLVLDMLCDFQLEPGYLHTLLRFWILFNLSILVGFL